MTVVEVEDLSVSLGQIPILHNISLSISAGECVGIVGKSGAGKSVLARTLLGLTATNPKMVGWQVSAQKLVVAETETQALSQRGWRQLRSRIGFVLQDAMQSLDPLRTVQAEVGEAAAISGVPRHQRRNLVLSAMNKAGLSTPESLLRSHSFELSGGMRQRTLIAAALVSDPALIIADEPTTALDATVGRRIVDVLASLRDQGKTVILVSHDLAVVSRIADRIVVMDAGRIVEVGPTEQIMSAPTHPATQELLAAIPRGPRSTADLAADTSTNLVITDLPAVEAKGISRTFTAAGRKVVAVDEVDLAVGRGQALGIVGESGSGKTTLARILVGADQDFQGQLAWAEDFVIRLVPQDPLASFDPRWTVERTLLASAKNGEDPHSLLAAVGLDDSFLLRYPVTLSGGERQRVAIARALAAGPQILVCDEPISALDTVTQAQILDLLRGLQQQRGLTLIFISHDLAAVRTICNSVAVMKEGRVVESGPVEEVFATPKNDFTRQLVAASELTGK